ncbi:unnamed protein product [Sphagnum jensenii]|uniref:Uncharacterized protein n=1 Tax=Sphagnum jensenii TaxID=128206 RepID=A0ABP0XI63_9BRYO
MLISGVPREVRDETNFKNPVDGGLFTREQQVFGGPERCSMSILGKHSDRLISLQGDRDVLSAGGLDAAGERGFSELPGAGRGLGCFRYLIDPFRRDIHVSFPLADPVPHLWPAVGGGWVPGNTGDDEVFILPIGGVEAHPKCKEAFQVLQLGVPEVPNPGATGTGERISFASTVESKGSAFYVGDEGVPKYRLPEQLRGVSRF